MEKVKQPPALQIFVNVNDILEEDIADTEMKLEQEENTEDYIEVGTKSHETTDTTDTTMCEECDVCHNKYEKLQRMTCDDKVCATCVDQNGLICPKCQHGDAL